MADKKKTLIIIIMAVVLIFGMIVSIFIGQFDITFKQLCGIVFSQFADIKQFWTSQQEHILWSVRIPRIIVACLVGSALSTSGCVYQGVFENHMAAPDFLGASSGAALGAALGIFLGFNEWMITMFAFVLSILTIGIVYFIGNRTKSNKTVGLVLAGLMISALAQAGTCFIKLVADQTNQLPEITYWMMGSLTGVTMRDVLFSFVMIFIGIVPLFLLRWKLNVITIGEQEAMTMGVDVSLVRFISLLSATLVTAAAVSVSGMIGWVGLVIPHFCRKLVGNNYKYLLPASIFTGAIFLLLVDNISRNLFPVEIPIGILTAIIGAPFFIYLITREDKLV